MRMDRKSCISQRAPLCIYAVYHDIVPAGIDSCKKAVPLTLYKGCFHAEFLCDLLCHFYVIADQVVVLIVIRPRCQVPSIATTISPCSDLL